MSVFTTRLATLRCTKISPGGRPSISFAGTRESEQPTHRSEGEKGINHEWEAGGGSGGGQAGAGGTPGKLTFRALRVCQSLKEARVLLLHARRPALV